MNTLQERSLLPEDVRGDAWRILSPDISSINRLCHELDKKVFQLISERLYPLGVSMTQALFIIYMSYYTDRPIYQNMLEKAFGLTNPTVTASIRSLVKKEILYREQDSDDGRYYRLYLTEKGQELFVPCLRIFSETDDIVLSKLNGEEKAQLIALYKKMLA